MGTSFTASQLLRDKVRLNDFCKTMEVPFLNILGRTREDGKHDIHVMSNLDGGNEAMLEFLELAAEALRTGYSKSPTEEAEQN